MKLSIRQGHKKNSVLDLEKKKKKMENDTKTNTIIEFNQNLSCSVKCLAIKKNANVKPTSRLSSSKILMFAKISLMSFIHDVLEMVCFPNKIMREINIRETSGRENVTIPRADRHR